MDDIPTRLAGGSLSDHSKWYGYYLPNDESENSYTTMKLHAELMRDRLFHIICNEVILKNKHLFKDKIVLEVDCGPGFLSMLIARYAKVVIAIESSNLVELVYKNIDLNNIKNILVVQENIDDIQSLPGDITEVDVIVSQYIGFLFFDKKLLTRFLKARNRWLKPKGDVIPNCIRLFITAANYANKIEEIQANLRIGEFDLSSLKKTIFELPKNEIVPPENIATDCCAVRVINLRTFNIDNYQFSNRFHLTPSRQCPIHAFVLFFEVGFTRCHKQVFLSTSPHAMSTRWRQTVLYFEDGIHCSQNETISGEFVFRESKKCDRSLCFLVKVDHNGNRCMMNFSKKYIL